MKIKPRILNIEARNKLKILMFLLVICFGFRISDFGFIDSVSAQSASPSGTIRDSVKQKVAEELAKIKQAVAKKGFVGTITSKSDATITLTNINGKSRTAILTSDTIIKLTGGKDGTISDLKPGNFIIAMGDVDSENQMTAKRIIAILSLPVEKRRSFYGTVSQISSTSFTLKTPKSEELNFKVSAGTKYNDKFKFSDLKSNSRLVVIALVGGTTQSPTYTALKVFLLP